MITLRLPYPVSADDSGAPVDVGKIAMTYVSAEAKAYKAHVGWIAKASGVKITSNSISFAYTLHPKLTVKGEASKVRLDLSNCLKVVEDALNGIAYVDDKQVIEIHGKIGEPVKDGAITVTITPIVVVAAQSELV
jgi:crossover junction endodeoxyribonuclease RusA